MTIFSRRTRSRPGFLLFGLIVLGDASAIAAATLRVGPDKPYLTVRAAAQAVANGDIVEVDAGLYSGDVATWSRNGITVRGVGGRAHLRADGAAEAGKGIWVVSGADFTAENIEFSGAAVPDRNGAGIRAQGPGTLIVRNCYFHDNQDGILGGADSVLVENSIFEHNGYSDGRAHNIYIDHGGSFTLRWSYTHRAIVGHNVKSRALRNYILCNRIMDESDGTASYSVDLPQGGRSYLIGNVIEQGPGTQNPAVVAYAAESSSNGTLDLYVIHNTLVNNRTGGGTFVTLRSGTTARIVGNIFYGPGTPWSGGGTTTAHHNYVSSALDNAPGFLDPGMYDFRLTAASPVGASGIVDAGVDPGLSGVGFDLEPHDQYVRDAASEPRPVVGDLDLGAFELSGPPSDSGDLGEGPGRSPGLRLHALYPNPAPSGRTTLSFETALRQRVRLHVLSANGRLITTLVDREVGPGLVRIPWDGTDRRGRRVAAGKYFLRIETTRGAQSHPLLVVR